MSRRDDEPRGLLEVIRSLLDTLAEMDERNESTRRGGGRGRSGPFDIDFDYNIGIGPADPADARGSSRGVPESSRESPESSDDSVHTSVRREGDGYRIVADLPPSIAGDVEADVDRDAGVLELRVGDSALERIPLSDGELVVADVTVNNRIVEVRLVPSEGSE